MTTKLLHGSRSRLFVLTINARRVKANAKLAHTQTTDNINGWFLYLNLHFAPCLGFGSAEGATLLMSRIVALKQKPHLRQNVSNRAETVKTSFAKQLSPCVPKWKVSSSTQSSTVRERPGDIWRPDLDQSAGDKSDVNLRLLQDYRFFFDSRRKIYQAFSSSLWHCSTDVYNTVDIRYSWKGEIFMSMAKSRLRKKIDDLILLLDFQRLFSCLEMCLWGGKGK